MNCERKNIFGITSQWIIFDISNIASKLVGLYLNVATDYLFAVWPNVIIASLQGCLKSLSFQTIYLYLNGDVERFNFGKLIRQLNITLTVYVHREGPSIAI